LNALLRQANLPPKAAFISEFLQGLFIAGAGNVAAAALGDMADHSGDGSEISSDDDDSDLDHGRSGSISDSGTAPAALGGGKQPKTKLKSNDNSQKIFSFQRNS
jgi:hypothetical protein